MRSSEIVALRGRACLLAGPVGLRRRRQRRLVRRRRRSRRRRGRRCWPSSGKGEGKVNLIAWAGYVEDGSTDPKVDWVSDFEKQTGCKVNVKVGNTSDEMVTLMRTGHYDGVSASGDATLRLIAGGDVAPVNTDLVPNYADVFPGLKDQRYNSVDGQMYGVPHGRGANLLMWRTDKVKPAPDSLGRGLRPGSSPYKGKVTAYDNPIYIADAALYLKATQPDLGIDNPYELDDKQFKAAVDLLKTAAQVHRRVLVGLHEGAGGVRERRHGGRHDLAGDREPARGRQGAGQDDAAEGGRDRLVGHLDDLLEGQAPELHVHVDGPHHLARRRTRRWRSGSARRRRTRRRARRPRTRTTATIFHADDEDYFAKVALLDHAAQATAATTAATSARTTPSGSRPGRRSRASDG